MAKKGGKRSGGGGGSKQRKYTRDNNGRFASTGTGATARGGRLKTAAGNKRKTQTAKMTGSKTASTVAKPKSLNAGTLKPKAATAAAPKAAKAAKSGMQATKRTPLAPDSSIAKRLAMFKSDKQLTDQRTKSLRAGLKKETNPLKKIETSSAISESQLKSKSYSNEITRMEARPIMGKRAGGRGDKPVSGPKAKHPNTIKGKPKRDAKVASKVKAKINLNAGRYKNIYINSANQKGKAAAKPKPRSIR